MGRRIVQFTVSGDLIRKALAMPDDTLIYGIVRHDWSPDAFVFFVEHPDLPEMGEGESPLKITPKITADYEKKPSMWLTWDWDLPGKEQDDEE